MNEKTNNADDSKDTLVSVTTSATDIECRIVPLLKVDVPPVIEDGKCFLKCPFFWVVLILTVGAAAVTGFYMHALLRVETCGIKWACFYEQSLTIFNPMYFLWWCFAVMCLTVIAYAVYAYHRHAMAKVLRDHSRNMVDATNGFVINALKTVMSSGVAQKRANRVSVLMTGRGNPQTGNGAKCNFIIESAAANITTTQPGPLSTDF